MTWVQRPELLFDAIERHHATLCYMPNFGFEVMTRAGISFFPSDRGGDVTYHGPGQLVGYPIVDLREWKRDVGAYVRAVEQVIVDTLADFGIAAGRIAGLTGVWVDGRKIAAIEFDFERGDTAVGDPILQILR